MPTPGATIRRLPERLRALGVGTLREDLEDLATLGSWSTASGPGALSAADLPEGLGRHPRQPRGGPLLLRDHRAHGDEGFGAGNFRALFESIEREPRPLPGPRARPALMLDRITRGQVPPRPHTALPSRGRRRPLRGMPDPRRLRRPVLNPLSPAPPARGAAHRRRAHGFRTPPAARARPGGLLRRHYRCLDLAPGVGPSTAGSRCSTTAMSPSASRGPPCQIRLLRERRRRRPLLHLAGGGTLRSVFGDLRFAAGDYVGVPKGVLHRLVPDAAAPGLAVH